MKKLLILITIIYLHSFTIHAQFSEDALRFSQQENILGARALGMGSAYIGVADDFSATHYNPAGLAQMRRLEIAGGLSINNYTNAVNFLGQKTTADKSSTSLNNFGVVFPFPTVQGSLVFAISYNRIADFAKTRSFNGFNEQSSIIPTLIDGNDTYDIPFNIYLVNKYNDGTVFTPIQNNVQQSGEVQESGGKNALAFSGAIDVAENISFGITLNAISGNYQYIRNYKEEDTKNIYQFSQPITNTDSAVYKFDKFYYDSKIEDELSGASFIFGLMYRMEMARFGFTIKTSGIAIKETYSDAGESVFDDNNIPSTVKKKYSYEAKNSYGVNGPWTFGFGGSVFPIPNLLLAGDIEYTDWTQMAWTSNDDLVKENSALSKKFRSVINYRFGIEYEISQISNPIRIRVGYMKNPSAFKNDPNDFDYTAFTGGVGILLQDNLLLDVAGVFGSTKTYHNNYTSLIKDVSRTDETISTRNIYCTISYRF